MNRKIIIKAEDFSREIFSFLTEIGADMPIDWNIGALTRVKNAVIETFGKMGVTLEVDERPQSALSSFATKRLTRRANLLHFLVEQTGFEPATYALRMKI